MPKRSPLTVDQMQAIGDPDSAPDSGLDQTTVDNASQPQMGRAPKRAPISIDQMRSISGSDPSSAGLQATDPYAQQLSETMGQLTGKAQALQQSVAYGTKQDPDQYAQLLELQRRTGVAPVMGKDYQKQLKASADANAINYPQFVQSNPQTAEWASTPDNAAIAGADEIARIAQIEAQSKSSRLWGLTPSQQQAVIEDRQRMFLQHYARSGGTPAGTALSEAESLGANIDTAVSKPIKSIVDSAGAAWEDLTETPKAIMDAVTGVDTNLGENLKQIWADKQHAAIEKYTGAVQDFFSAPILDGPSQVLKDPKTGEAFQNPDYAWWGRPLANAFEQVPGTLAAFAVGGEAAAPEYIAPQLGASAYQEGYRQAKAAGADESTAITSALGQGISTYALMGLMPPGVPASTIPRAIGQAGLRSIALGATMTASENAFARAYDPQRPLWEGWQQSLATMAAYEGVGAMHNILDLAAESKLKTRSQEKFADAVRAATDGTPAENIRVPLEQWNQYWQDQKMDPAQVAEQLGISKAYVEAKLGAGGDDVVVPTADFTAKLDNKHLEGLKPDIRGYDDVGNPTQTARELAEDQTPEGLERKRQAIQDVHERMQQANEEAQSSPEWLEVKEEMRQRRIARGDSPEEAEANSTLDANVLSNLAREAKMTPIEALRLKDPKLVVGEAPGFERPGTPEPPPAEPLLSPEETDSTIKRFDRLTEPEIRSASSMSGEDLNSLFNEWHEKQQALMEEGRAIGDPDLARATQMASLAHQLERRRAEKDLAPAAGGEDVLHQAAIEKIRSVVEAANQPGDVKKWTKYAPVSDWLRGAAKDAGLALDGFEHGIDADAVRHAKGEHGEAETESSRGQIAITDEDFEKIPEIVHEPDHVIFGGKTRVMGKDLDAIVYVKKLDDGTIAYVEEVRTGRNRLAAKSMWKYPAVMDADRIADHLHLNVRNAGGRTDLIVVPGPGADKNDVLYQSAFHGSPHRFDKFTLSKIGTGEGAQAYGHGLYFAGDRAIAEYYREKLSGDTLIDGKPADSSRLSSAASMIMNMFRNRKIARLSDKDARAQTAEWAKTHRQIREWMTPEQVDAFVKRLSVGKGQLYEADIPEEYKMLDWDKPLSEQSASVKAALSYEQNVYRSSRGRSGAYINEASGRQIYQEFVRAYGSPEAASKELNSLGIGGIKYLAGIARAKGEGPRNYVVFDDRAIKILNTYYQAQKGEGPRGWTRMLPDGTVEVGRTPSGDPSTDRHEMGHVYLQVIGKLVQREGVSETLKADHQKILTFLGAESLDNLTREQHEKWAKAVEAYMQEGKAPSASLRPVFQRFGVWLSKIYEKASGLGVKLTPDMRGVMERLHAAEEGVNQAAAEAGPKMFSSADEIGWTEEQFKNWAEAHDVSIEQAKEHILARQNEARLREQTENWREEEKNVRDAVTTQTDQQPEYAAIRQLRKGALDDGSPIAMNKEALVKQFGEERVKALQKQHPGMYRNEGGTEPETAAELFGFTSAEEMLQAMEAAPSRKDAIETATRQYMTAKHGDIRYDGTLHDQARIALENDKKAQGTYAELKALRRKVADMKAANEKQKAASRAISIAPMKAYQEFAHQTIESKSASELTPARYLDASRKYSRESFEALRRGDYEKAEEAKHKELVNHYLFREAVQAQEYFQKFEANTAKWQKKGVQSKLGLAGSDHQDQFNHLMGRYGAAPQTPLPDRTLVEWAGEQNNLGYDPAIDNAMYNEGRQVNYRKVPIAEIRLLHDALKNIKTIAYKQLEQVVGGKTIAFHQAIGELVDRAQSTGKSTPVRVLKRNQTRGEWWSDLVQRGDALAVRMEFLMDELDGGATGPWHDYLWNLSADAQGRESELHAQTTKLVGQAIENMTPEERRSRLEKVTIPGISETVTRHDLISWVFNMGNEGNLDRLRKTFVETGWDPSVIPSLPGYLRPNELRFIQDAAQSLIPLGKEQFALERRQTGLSPVMVEPAPFSTTTADGTEMHMDGWYYPIQMDPRFSVRGALQDVGATAQNLMEAGYGRAATSRGAMKQRTGFGGALDMDYEQVMTQHVAKVVKDITYREFMLAANKILTDPRIRQVLRERLGEGYEEKMMPWLRGQINDRNGSSVQGLSDVSKAIRVLRTNLVKAALTFKVSTVLLQLTHASSVLLHTTPSAYAQSMIDFLAHPKQMTEEIKRLSPNEMRFRGDSLDRDMRAILQDRNYKPGLAASYDRSTTAMARAGMMPVHYTDHMLSFPLWMAVYRKGLAENANLSEDKAHYQAMHKADGAVRMALGANAPKDLPAIMRNNDLTKLLTMLGGFHNLKYNQIRGVGKQFGRDRSVLNLAYGAAMAAILPALIGSLVAGQRPKDDENPGLWAARKALLFPVETIPIIGAAAEAWERGTDVSFTPLANWVAKGIESLQHLDPEKQGERDWTGLGMSSLQTAMDAAGVPGTDQIFKTARYVRKAHNDEIENPNVWDAVMGAPRH